MSSSRITLPRIRSIEKPPEEAKLCGGDLYRARAPTPPKEPLASEARGYERRVTPRPPRDPRKVVDWTDETVAAMQRLLASGLSREATAKELNRLFPQKCDVQFTKNSICGKLNNIKLYGRKTT